eukprot:3155577-Alexandrium_andersonii.AAC.1
MGALAGKSKMLSCASSQRLARMGSPAQWATWHDESINAVAKRVANVAHRRVRAERVLVEFKAVVHGPLKRSRTAR